MCIIVDTNVAAEFFRRVPAYEPVWVALVAHRTRLVRGGKLAGELVANAEIARIIAELDRQGLMWVEDNVKVDRATDKVRNRGLCQSDDYHIIALALVSGSRLLCTRDKALMTDFTNPG